MQKDLNHNIIQFSHIQLRIKQYQNMHYKQTIQSLLIKRFQINIVKIIFPSQLRKDLSQESQLFFVSNLELKFQKLSLKVITQLQIEIYIQTLNNIFKILKKQKIELFQKNGKILCLLIFKYRQINLISMQGTFKAKSIIPKENKKSFHIVNGFDSNFLQLELTDQIQMKYFQVSKF
ncbi:unnamed protein product [Paramecium sonneborni]|uniref:Uncharacterized protein n=1 Tax=Paramecium sonneborni TaxID=65129 RepID=A0A8S1KC88_9CILI|nr:unnamed protein product [Paramecium sonneborni]